MAYAQAERKYKEPFPPLLVRSATVPDLNSVVNGAGPDADEIAPSSSKLHHHHRHQQRIRHQYNPSPSGGAARSGFDPRSSRPVHNSAASSRSLLAPEDAVSESAAARRLRRSREGERNTIQSRRSRNRRSWKKLLWVKQAYADNYTDPETFLESLQRNPRLKLYDFWPLVADSTVIVQHVCSVIVFVACFIGIFQERISAVVVVGGSTVATTLGWALWERWVADEDARYNNEIMQAMAGAGQNNGDQRSIGGAGGGESLVAAPATAPNVAVANVLARSGSSRRTGSIRRRRPTLRGDTVAPGVAAIAAAAAAAAASASASLPTPAGSPQAQAYEESPEKTPTRPTMAVEPSPRTILAASPIVETSPPTQPMSQISAQLMWPVPPAQLERAHERVGTIKSATLIVFTLLGMSPILKSLTRSTSSDSIWAMSLCLLVLNVFSFDYSSSDASQGYPASLSTNAALMASTMLASRLPSTGHVFGLTLFSIEVFGLFPVFRRHLRERSWRYHVLLTAGLVFFAGAGVGIILSDPAGRDGLPWKAALGGMFMASWMAVLAMGGCSWWLIGLQRYKNEIRGPWDPARPVIMSRRRWNNR